MRRTPRRGIRRHPRMKVWGVSRNHLRGDHLFDVVRHTGKERREGGRRRPVSATSLMPFSVLTHVLTPAPWSAPDVCCGGDEVEDQWELHSESS